MGKGASKVLAVEYLSGLWICGEDKRKCVDAYMIILKGYAIARSLPLWLFLCHGTANSPRSFVENVDTILLNKNPFRVFLCREEKYASPLSLQFTNYYPVSYNTQCTRLK